MWAVWDEKRFLLAVFALALDGVELALAEAEMLGGDLEKLVVEQEIETLLETELSVGSKLDGTVGSVSAHISELLFAADVDVEVVFFVTEADNHSLVDIGLGRNVESAARLGGVEGVGGRGASLKADESTVAFGFILGVGGLVAVGDTGHNDRATGGGEEAIAQADEGGGGDFIGEARGVLGGDVLGLEFSFSDAEFLRNSADKFGVDFDI